MSSALIISFVEWAGAFQRPHHLALGLARRGWRVTYASPGYLHRRRGRVASGLALPPGLQVIEPPALPGASRLAAVGKLNEWLMLRWLQRATVPARGSGVPPSGGSSIPQSAIQVRMPSEPSRPQSSIPHSAFRIPHSLPVLIFNDPRWCAVAAALPAARRIFDCMDDLSAAGPSPAWAARMEERALRVADRVWTGTASLADRLTGRHPAVRFIPCGVDAERFAAPAPGAIDAARADLPPGEGPLAGYFGVLNERVDARLIAALLDSGWRVLLIGPSTSRAPALPRSDRLRSIGPRPYAALPGYLAHFDLALIPYDTAGPHRFLYPVKALEYLAAGKPVLTTPLPDVVRFLGDYVELADTPAAWSAAGRRLFVDRAAALSRAAQGRRYTHSRSWDAMVDEMEPDLRPD